MKIGNLVIDLKVSWIRPERKKPQFVKARIPVEVSDVISDYAIQDGVGVFTILERMAALYAWHRMMISKKCNIVAVRRRVIESISPDCVKPRKVRESVVTEAVQTEDEKKEE